VPGPDVGQPRGEAKSKGPRLQVQGSRLRRGDLASAWSHGAGTGCAVGRAREQRPAPAAGGVRGWRGGGSWGSGRQWDAPLPHLRRRDVGRPCDEAQPAGAGLQVSEQAARARRPGVRRGHLAGARRLAEPLPAADRTTLGGRRERGAAPLGWSTARRRAAAGRRRSAFLEVVSW